MDAARTLKLIDDAALETVALDLNRAKTAIASFDRGLPELLAIERGDRLAAKRSQ